MWYALSVWMICRTVLVMLMSMMQFLCQFPTLISGSTGGATAQTHNDLMHMQMQQLMALQMDQEKQMAAQQVCNCPNLLYYIIHTAQYQRFLEIPAQYIYIYRHNFNLYGACTVWYLVHTGSQFVVTILCERCQAKLYQPLTNLAFWGVAAGITSKIILKYIYCGL